MTSKKKIQSKPYVYKLCHLKQIQFGSDSSVKPQADSLISSMDGACLVMRAVGERWGMMERCLSAGPLRFICPFRPPLHFCCHQHSGLRTFLSYFLFFFLLTLQFMQGFMVLTQRFHSSLRPHWISLKTVPYQSPFRWYAEKKYGKTLSVL